GPVVPGRKARRGDVGPQAAFQDGSLAAGPPGPAQIDRARRAVRDKVAVPKDEAQALWRGAGGGHVAPGLAVGGGIVRRAEDALLKQGVRTAKDEVDVPGDLAALVILGAGPPGDEYPRAQEAVFLPFFFGQGSAEQGVLAAKQPHPAEYRPPAVHIGGDALAHPGAGAGVVLDGHVLHRQPFAAEKGGPAAESVGGPP